MSGNATNTAPRRRLPIRILFIHQNFPGQFARIALDLARDPGYQVLAVGKEGCPKLAGVRTVTYKLHRATGSATHRYAVPYEAGILHGQACLRLLIKLKAQGFLPDVVVAHPGWGEAMFVKEAFPTARVIHFCEYYYHTDHADLGFDPEFPSSLDDRARVRAKNALQLLNLESCDIAISPTQWQKQLHPTAYHNKIHVAHEGIDTDYMCPDARASFTLPNGRVLRVGDPVVTYVSRNLEPYRGFHAFMRSLPKILEQNPDCEIVIAGGDDVSYGGRPADAANWRLKMLREVDIDANRVHFLGRIAYSSYRSLLQVSAAHVYLTYPFVLSWSMLEAMACGCLLISSRTAPVCEVITNGKNGMLVDFFDVNEIAETVREALCNMENSAGIRNNAVRSVRKKYSIKNGIAQYRSLIQSADK
jgi:glycosyltransferase involved in cell wall biosynthesis